MIGIKRKYISSMKLNYQFIKFGIVGTFGALVNFSVYWSSTTLFPNLYMAASSMAFCMAVTTNYIFNQLWTFQTENKKSKLSFFLYFKYIVVNLFGLAINLVTLYLIVHFFGLKMSLLGQLVGIILGMISNYLLSKYLVFQKVD